MVMVFVSAVALVSFAGFRAIDWGLDNDRIAVDDPWAGYEVFERTAEVGNFTITSPSNWYLVNQWPWARIVVSDLKDERQRKLKACSNEPTQGERQVCRSSLMGAPGDGFVTPMILLGNTDRGIESSPCFDPGFSVGPDEALMTIALDSLYFNANVGSGDRTQWPVPFDTSAVDDRPSCGPGTYVYFASGDFPYVAHFAFGQGVPIDERQTLIHSFESMQVGNDSDVIMQESLRDDYAAYVIAGGENAAGPWTLELSPSRQDIRLMVNQSGGGSDRSISDITPFPLPAHEPIHASIGDPTFGVVSREAAEVELRPDDGAPPSSATIVPLPPSLPFGFDLFFANYEPDVPAEAVALDQLGDPLAFPTAMPSVSEDPSGTFLDQVEHLSSSERWAPATRTDAGLIMMPITFPDGATAELVYPADLALENLNFYPDTYGVLEGKSSSCGWPVHASRYDPRGGWVRGDEPLDSFVTTTDRVVELWEGTRDHEPYNYLLSRSGSWNVIVPCDSVTTITGDTLQWAELVTAFESPDGLLVFEDAAPLDMHQRHEGATVRISGGDVVVDLSSKRAGCEKGEPDFGAEDGVVQWCIEPAGGVYVYANAFKPAQESFLERLVTDLQIRGYRPSGG